MECEVCTLRKLAQEPDPPMPDHANVVGLPPPRRNHWVALSTPDQIAHVEAHLFDALERLAALEVKLFSTAQPSADRSATRSA